MIKVVRPPEGKKRPHNAPWATLYPQRWLSRLGQWLGYHWRTFWTRLEARHSIVPNRSWRRRRPSFHWVVSIVGTLLLLLWVGATWWSSSQKPVPQKLPWLNVLSGFISFLVAAASLGFFLLYRYRKSRKPIVEQARKHPHELVPTSGTMVDQIVGRRELAQVIAETLRDRRTRKPYLLIGGVGTGKTAVLVELTRVLAEQQAVPVPIQLRDASGNGELDFEEIAKRRFLELADQSVPSSAQGERTWRQLRMDDKAVVLADGLEEAVQDEQHRDDRDNIIRRAIDRAYRQGLPLVIASRPHTPLESAPAAIMKLEPLSEEAVLEYLLQDAREADERRLDWIVETANVSDSPIYMRIARILQQHDCLEHLGLRRHPGHLDTRSHDCSRLRLLLLETWRQALVEGRLESELVLSPGERAETVVAVSALACAGMLQDSLEVVFDDVVGRGSEAAAAGARSASRLVLTAGQLELIKEVARDSIASVSGEAVAEDEYQIHRQVAKCAAFGQQLGLTVSYENKVRFPHSIIQAFLGFYLLSRMDVEKVVGMVGPALEPPGPGRELLIALVLLSRQRPDAAEALTRMLRDAAGGRRDAKALDLCAAALEIGAVSPDLLARGDIAEELKRAWKEVLDDQRTVEEAKLRLVYRYGEVLREAGEAGRQLSYDLLFEIGCIEESYPVRLAIAQEMGAGGDAAYRAVLKGFPAGEDPVARFLQEKRRLQRAWADAYQEWLSAVDGQGNERLQDEIFRSRVKDLELSKEELCRHFVMRAWIGPTLVGSVSEKYRDEAKERLDFWLGHLGPAAVRKPDLPLSLENALAQGFKNAANRRRRHASTSEETRTFLINRAEKMLGRSRYWYSQLSLLQALCLWELPDAVGQEASAVAAEHRPRQRSHKAASASGHDQVTHGTADPVRSVAHWLSLIGAEHRAAAGGVDHDRLLHPFVAEAGDLATLALETGHPEFFIWIDEKMALDNVGSRPADPDRYRKHNLWIPPSVGWSILHPRAQRLVADVLIMNNLTGRNGKFDEVEERLRLANQEGLPPCLTQDRGPLHPEFTVGKAEADEPGSTCLPNCPFRLCPYPPRSRQPQAELEEPFCRQQEALLHARARWRLVAVSRHTPPWVGTPVRRLHRFWEAMADRNRTTGVGG
ncbi:ATP-binding protein [Kitasatospora sp. NPDC093102]|uniref:ATP-binding protein n=1 Tax=Kitasatospora sp. NPDC093102 TaxID=3155069 RepID=UPI00342EEC1E